MPFFTVFRFDKKIGRIRIDANEKNIKNVTLQVRIPLTDDIEAGKRVLSSAFRRRAAGSLTVEAALVLSLFLFAIIIMMMPMRILNENRKLQSALEKA